MLRKLIKKIVNRQSESVHMTPINYSRQMSHTVFTFVSKFQLSMFPRKGDAS